MSKKVQARLDALVDRNAKLESFLLRVADHMLGGGSILGTTPPTEREWRDILYRKP